MRRPEEALRTAQVQGNKKNPGREDFQIATRGTTACRLRKHPEKHARTKFFSASLVAEWRGLTVPNGAVFFSLSIQHRHEMELV
jgi:hypothetical protein